MADTLAQFMSWWLEKRPFRVPFSTPIIIDGNIFGAVLYRSPPWQVQLFILKPNSVVPEHQHPNVDSFEVYLSGEIEFSLSGEIIARMEDSDEPDFSGLHKLYGTSIRVVPLAWHGARTGAKGGAFLSVQKWLNDVAPTNVGDDWAHRDGETRRNFVHPESSLGTFKDVING
jgi:hypothetical protein